MLVDVDVLLEVVDVLVDVDVLLEVVDVLVDVDVLLEVLDVLVYVDVLLEVVDVLVNPDPPMSPKYAVDGCDGWKWDRQGRMKTMAQIWGRWLKMRTMAKSEDEGPYYNLLARRQLV